MTSVDLKEKSCFICETVSEYPTLRSTNMFGAPDLDTRPPPMFRSTINLWIQHCPACGYCAPDISEGPVATRLLGTLSSEKAVLQFVHKSMAELLRAPAYLNQKNHSAFPKTANYFLCWAKILEALTRDYASSGWALLRAAWVCDDAETQTAAKECRKRATDRFAKARAMGMSFGDSQNRTTFPGTMFPAGVRLVDLRRGAGIIDVMEAKGITFDFDLLKAGGLEGDKLIFEAYFLRGLGQHRAIEPVETRLSSWTEGFGAEETMVLADALRRSEQFEQVKVVYQEALAKNPKAAVRKILDFQLKLALNHDTGCYTIHDAIDG